VTSAPADSPATDTRGLEFQPGLSLTRTHKLLIGIVATAVVTIAGIGFAGSYTAVSELALAKGFGAFAQVFPIGVDAGIVAFLALDLLLTWFRIPFPLLRHGAWALTVATIAFNAAAAWPDPLGVGMHATIPALFVVAVEAARHAVGRIAEITADKHIESPPLSRWLLNPVGTFVLWRRQRLWGIRAWEAVLKLERERRIYVAQLRQLHGRKWRRQATAAQALVLSLTKDGMSIVEALQVPALVPLSAPELPVADATVSAGDATQAPATARPSLPATDAPATKLATRSATSGAAGSATPATAVPATTVSATAAPATRSATPATAVAATPVPATTTPATAPAMEVPATTEPATTTPATADATTEVRYEPGTPQHVVKDLWLTKGNRPKEGDIVDALGAAGLPNSRAQAGKIRRQVAEENPSLPGPHASAA